MERFVIEQKWITKDGKLHGEVVEIADEGVSGIVEIMDDSGGQDTFRGTAEAFQLLPAGWQVVT
jgi:hypothetical protein